MAKPKALLFVGPPGSGKGTQAALLVGRFEEYRNFDTGRAIESVVMDPAVQDDPVIRTERERFEKGLLSTPSWTTHIIQEGVKRIAMSGFGVVLSGSPRTREEADMLIPLLTDIYGEGSIVVFH